MLTITRTKITMISKYLINIIRRNINIQSKIRIYKICVKLIEICEISTDNTCTLIITEIHTLITGKSPVNHRKYIATT